MHMLPAPDGNLTYLVGQNMLPCTRPLAPYNDLACEFMNRLSAQLLADAEAKTYPDVAAFAFWCRRANIEKLKREFAEPRVRLGLGVAFHIAPANVPVNFAFSFAFALLSGNASIVRVPTRDFAQTRIVCRAINRLFENEEFQKLQAMTVFVRYPQDDAITGAFSAISDARIIWGGDQAISSIRKLPVPERAREIAFADRYSFCVMDAASVNAADGATLARLAQGFYNDTYLMDQNACSSPHLVVWLGDAEACASAQKAFWSAVYTVAASQYELQPVNAVDKLVLLCESAIEVRQAASVERGGNYLYRVALNALPDNVDEWRGKCGYLYEYRAGNLDGIARIVNSKYQTLTYFGVGLGLLKDFVVANRLTGIDRVVPVGTALDIGVIWDGYDIVRTLSRVIDFV